LAKVTEIARVGERYLGDSRSSVYTNQKTQAQLVGGICPVEARVAYGYPALTGCD